MPEGDGRGSVNSPVMRPSWPRYLRDAALLLTAAVYSAGYATVGLLVILLVVVGEGLAVRRFPWAPSPLDWPLAAFLAMFLISGWLSPYRPIAVGSAGLAALAVYLAYGTLMRATKERPGFARSFLTAWFMGGVAAAGIAIYHHLLTGMPGATPVLGRNAVGTTLLLALLIGLGLLATSRSRSRYAIAAGLLPVCLGLIFTYTRGAWLGAAAGIIMLWILVRPPLRATIMAAAVLTVSLTLPLMGSERNSLVQRARTIVSLAPNQDRVVFVRTAWRIFLDHPALGTGLNTFSITYPLYAPGAYAAQTQPFAHNIWLNMAAEGGIPGVILFTWVVIAAALVGVTSIRGARDRADRILQMTILSALVGLLVHQLFDGTVASVHLGAGLWFLAALLGTRSHTTRRAETSALRNASTVSRSPSAKSTFGT